MTPNDEYDGVLIQVLGGGEEKVAYRKLASWVPQKCPKSMSVGWGMQGYMLVPPF